MHHNTKLLPYQRREAYRRWLSGEKVTHLAAHYNVSRECLYRVFKKAQLGYFGNFTSKNKRFCTIEYGLKSLAKTEKKLAIRLAKRERRAIRYERKHPGELVHFDTKKLPLLAAESPQEPREWLHVAVDDYCRWLVAEILPDKTSYASAIHLAEVVSSSPYRMEATYSDNGSEYKGKATHPFVLSCTQYGLKQYFTRPRRPQTNGKAERVIQTIMKEWHSGRHFTSREQRRRYLYAFVNWYNQVRPHQSLQGQSPLQRLESYLAQAKESVNNA